MKDFRLTVQLIQTTRRKHGNDFGFLRTKADMGLCKSYVWNTVLDTCIEG